MRIQCGFSECERCPRPPPPTGICSPNADPLRVFFSPLSSCPLAVTREARDMAEELGVHIFSADIIYHLFDQFKAYLQKVRGVIGQLWVTAFEP